MKRALSVVLAVILVLSVAITANAYSTAKYQNGDVNRDGRLSISDATEIQRSIASITILYEEQEILADYNLDGSVNVRDATNIQRVLANLAEAPF